MIVRGDPTLAERDIPRWSLSSCCASGEPFPAGRFNTGLTDIRHLLAEGYRLFVVHFDQGLYQTDIHVYDISTPIHPRPIAVCYTADFTRDLDVVGNHLFMASGSVYPNCDRTESPMRKRPCGSAFEIWRPAVSVDLL